MTSSYSILGALGFTLLAVPALGARPNRTALEPRHVAHTLDAPADVRLTGLGHDERKDALIELLRSRALGDNAIAAIEHVGLDGQVHVDPIDTPLAAAFGKPGSVAEAGTAKLIFAPSSKETDLAVGLNYTSSRILAIRFTPEAAHAAGGIEAFRRRTSVERGEGSGSDEFEPRRPRTEASSLEAQIREAFTGAAVGSGVERLRQESGGFITAGEFFKRAKTARTSGAPLTGYFLGYSYHQGLLPLVLSVADLIPPRDFDGTQGFYNRFGVKPGEPGHSQKIMDRIASSGETTYFFVPPSVADAREHSATRTELEYLLRATPAVRKNVVFVFGAYGMLPRAEFVAERSKRTPAELLTYLRQRAGLE